jgi:hypothetical protein
VRLAAIGVQFVATALPAVIVRAIGILGLGREVRAMSTLISARVVHHCIPRSRRDETCVRIIYDVLIKRRLRALEPMESRQPGNGLRARCAIQQHNSVGKIAPKHNWRRIELHVIEPNIAGHVSHPELEPSVGRRCWGRERCGIEAPTRADGDLAGEAIVWKIRCPS